jgi:hypothetical protein
MSGDLKEAQYVNPEIWAKSIKEAEMSTSKDSNYQSYEDYVDEYMIDKQRVKEVLEKHVKDWLTSEYDQDFNIAAVARDLGIKLEYEE